MRNRSKRKCGAGSGAGRRQQNGIMERVRNRLFGSQAVSGQKGTSNRTDR